MKKRVSIDLALILVWPLVATLLSFLVKPNALGSIIIFLLVPAIYLSVRGKEYVKKAAVFSLIVGIPVMIVLDYIAQVSGSWIMYPVSILPFKFFGIVTLEIILWAVFTCYFIIIFYEYFINHHATKYFWKSKMKYLLTVVLTLFTLFVLFYFASPSSLKIPYFYLLWGVVLLLIPFLLYLLKYPKTTSKFFLAGAYFFYLHFIYEVAALKLGWWVFPSVEFIGWVSVFGVSFPLEEVIFWFILLALTTVAAYELFDDDNR